MIKYASYFKSFNDLIELKSTGTVAQMAERFEIGETTVKKVVAAMRIVFNTPIKYDRSKKTYFYEVPGVIILDFKSDLRRVIQRLQKVVDEQERGMN